MLIYIVQELNSMEIIGVYDTLENAKLAGKFHTKNYIVVEEEINNNVNKRKIRVVYEY